MDIARSHYETLGVVPTASAADIHAAYKRLARRVHPDAGGDAAQMAALNEAHRVLSDPGRRANYDAGRRPATAGPARYPAAGFHGDEAEPDLLGDEDDDADFVPMAGWQHRLPAWSILVLGSLFAVFLFTAYAQSGRRTTTSTPPPVDGALVVGSCVAEGPGGVVDEVACGGRYTGVVMALINVGERCPLGTDGLRRHDDAGYACVRRN